MFGGRFRNRLCVRGKVLFRCSVGDFGTDCVCLCVRGKVLLRCFFPLDSTFLRRPLPLKEQHNFNAKERKSETECPEAVLFLITLPVRQNFG